MKNIIAKKIKKVLDERKIKLTADEIEKYIEIPPSIELGDYSFPCFFLAEKFRKSPEEIATDVRKNIDEKGFEDVQANGAYINFFIDRKTFVAETLDKVLKEKEGFGKFNSEKEKIMIEFSQPNTHKAFHVGHIRGTSIGESLARVLEFCGKEVIRANYQGDTGMHVAKWLWCYKKYHSGEKLKEKESWIASVYVEAVKKSSKSPKAEQEIREINRKLGTGEDKKLNELWKKTRKISLKSLEKIYSQLNTHFDVYYFESMEEEKGKAIAEILLKNKIAKLSEGAVIVNLEKYNLGVWVLLRNDKTVLYSAKDLALAEGKFLQYPDLGKSIYVIANEQNLHFNQLVKTLELMKFNQADKLKHVSFGMVRLPTGKMSSRTGENVLYSDFIEEMMKYSEKEIKDREPKIKKIELENRALKISIASIKYSMLKQGANKNIIFNPKEAINFEGDTGAYILYTYARASSILRKAKKKNMNSNNEGFEPIEFELINKLSKFAEIVENSCITLNPSNIAVYSYQISKIFNEFYHSCPVINSENESFRLAIVSAFRQVLKNSLNLLGIETLEKM